MQNMSEAAVVRHEAASVQLSTMRKELLAAIAGGTSNQSGACSTAREPCVECIAKDGRIAQLESQLQLLQVRSSEKDRSPPPTESASATTVVAACLPHGVFQLALPSLLARRDAEREGRLAGPVLTEVSHGGGSLPCDCTFPRSECHALAFWSSAPTSLVPSRLRAQWATGRESLAGTHVLVGDVRPLWRRASCRAPRDPRRGAEPVHSRGYVTVPASSSCARSALFRCLCVAFAHSIARARRWRGHAAPTSRRELSRT